MKFFKGPRKREGNETANQQQCVYIYRYPDTLSAGACALNFTRSSRSGDHRGYAVDVSLKSVGRELELRIQNSLRIVNLEAGYAVPMFMLSVLAEGALGGPE